MAQPTAEQIAQQVFSLGLLDERQLQEIWSSFGSKNIRADEFLQTLVRREFMTNYQVERLLKDEKTGFFYGDYKVLYLVGSGTFARVYRAVHRSTGKIVALKVLRNRYSDHPAQANQFMREGRVGVSLRHPNIVPTYDVTSQGRNYFLIMEFIEGRNLREFVRIRKKLDPLEATRMMIGITDGMAYAFTKGLTHRDLKMSNILVSSRGDAKIVDFGLASMDDTISDEKLADMPNTRTIDYAALERITGVRKDDSRSDVYFLGCIYYNMLTGWPPLSETRERAQRLSKQRFVNVLPIHKADPSLPVCVSVVANKAMMLEPEFRYQSPVAMLADLQSAERLLVEGRDLEGDAGTGSFQLRAGNQAKLGPSDTGRVVMVIESNGHMQDIFRKGFKEAGYRVLVTSDPRSAVSRLRQEPQLADCVIFNAQEIGLPALEMFNQLRDDQRTQPIPAMLLLDEVQRGWEAEANTATHRIVLPMPITMKRLRTAVAQLAPSKTVATSDELNGQPQS